MHLKNKNLNIFYKIKVKLLTIRILIVRILIYELLRSYIKGVVIMEDLKSKTILSDLIRGIGIKIKREADLAVNELGLNSGQGRMLGYIYENQEKGIIQRDLAEHFDLRGASVSSILQGLEEKGYIRRSRPEDNERQKNIYTLPKCDILISDFNKKFIEIESKLIKELTEEEVIHLEKLLRKVEESL